VDGAPVLAARPAGVTSSPPQVPPPATPTAAATFRATMAGVDLWTVNLDAFDPVAERALPAADRREAERLAFAGDRHRFLAGRAAVRSVLAAYRLVPPATLSLARVGAGKPVLAGGPPFSFSRSGAAGLLAVGVDQEIGVDLERLRDVPEAADLAARHLPPAERARWLAEGGDAWAFLRAWTRLEASLKALGLGLASAEEGRTPRGQVEVEDLDLVPGHAAALARVARR
jgi:phosphopantetheinyl transferase